MDFVGYIQCRKKVGWLYICSRENFSLNVFDYLVIGVRVKNSFHKKQTCFDTQNKIESYWSFCPCKNDRKLGKHIYTPSICISQLKKSYIATTLNCYTTSCHSNSQNCIPKVLKRIAHGLLTVHYDSFQPNAPGSMKQ